MFLKPHSNRNKIHKIEPNIAGSFLGLPSSEALISGHRPFDTVWNGAPKSPPCGNTGVPNRGRVCTVHTYPNGRQANTLSKLPSKQTETTSMDCSDMTSDILAHHGWVVMAGTPETWTPGPRIRASHQKHGRTGSHMYE